MSQGCPGDVPAPGKLPMLVKGSPAARRIADLYGSVADPGLSLKDIADLTGYAKATIWSCLRREGVAMRAPGANGWHPTRLPHREVDRRRFLYEEMGYSIAEVARIVGRSYTAVRWTLVRAGVPLRDSGDGQRACSKRRREHGPRLARID